MPITAIAFDWGGVFTEGTFDSSAVRNLASHAEVPETEIAATYFPLMAEFEAGAFDFDTFITQFLRKSGVRLSASEFRDVFLGSVRDRKEMYDVLASIPAHYTVGMLSNNVDILCDSVRNDPRMARTEHFVFSNEIKVRKPDPLAFAALTDALGVPPEETVFIDDHKGNIEACEALGYRGLWLESYGGFVTNWKTLLPDLPLP